MILMKIRSWGGTEWDAVMLSQCGQQIRIAVRGQEDAGELSYHDGQWFAENGDPVQIGILAPPAGGSHLTQWVN
jgi:hypothetical protein